MAPSDVVDRCVALLVACDREAWTARNDALMDAAAGLLAGRDDSTDGRTSMPEAIWRWRKARGLTQAQLAERAGCSAALIGHAEKGIRSLGGDNLQAVAGVLLVPVAALAASGRA